MPEIKLSPGTIHYRDEGTGPPVLLIHGLLVNGSVWDPLASLTVDPIPDVLVRAWVAPLRSRAVRRDLVKVLRGIAPAHTLNAAERLRRFERPVLIAWGTRDAFFPMADAERLAALFPDARLEKIDGARTFVQMDRPERLAEMVSAFAPG